MPPPHVGKRQTGGKLLDAMDSTADVATPVERLLQRRRHSVEAGHQALLAQTRQAGKNTKDKSLDNW